PADEGDVDWLAVEIPLEVEHVGFQQWRAIVEGRPRPEARDTVMDLVVDRDPHRVDAVLEPALRVERDIRGRKPEIASALITCDHGAVREPRIAEQLGRLDDAALDQRGADRGGGDRAPFVLERRRGLDREAMARALLAQESRRAAPLMAEVKIEADGRTTHA